MLVVKQFTSIYQTLHFLLKIPLLGIYPADILTYAQGKICVKQSLQHCLQQQQIGNTTNIIIKDTVLNKLQYIHILEARPAILRNITT